MNFYAIMPQLVLLGQLVFPSILFLIEEERKKYFLLRAGISIICSILLLHLYMCIPVTSYPMARGILSYFLIYLFAVLFVLFSYKISVVSAIFVSSSSYALQHISFCLSGMAAEKLEYGSGIIFFCVLIQIILCLLFYFVALRRSRYIYRNADFRQVFMSMLILLICITLNSLRSDETGEILYANLYDLLLCGSCLMLQFSMSYSAKIHEENKILELLISQQHEQHKLSQQAFNMLNIKIHNIRHQLTSIQQVVGKGGDTELQSFARTLQIYDTMANTGNATLDAVLMETGLLCEINDVRFSFIADGKQLDFMETADLFSLISNILDNAIESELKETDKERRIINLRILRNHDMILLDAENYCRYPVDVQENLIQTTKPDKENHGLGMRGIDYVVKKYGGDMTLSQDDNFFRIGIIFPVETE